MVNVVMIKTILHAFDDGTNVESTTKPDVTKATMLVKREYACKKVTLFTFKRLIFFDFYLADVL